MKFRLTFSLKVIQIIFKSHLNWSFVLQIRGKKELTIFEPHDNTNMYEAHIQEAKLGYNADSGRFRRKTLLDSTSMVMSPVDILEPDLQVNKWEQSLRIMKGIWSDCSSMEVTASRQWTAASHCENTHFVNLLSIILTKLVNLPTFCHFILYTDGAGYIDGKSVL